MAFVICHYGEIGLKGKNRKIFEEQLVKNIKSALRPTDFKYVKRISGRIIIELLKEAEQRKLEKSLKNVFGIVYFAFAENCKQEIKEIQKKALEKLAQASLRAKGSGAEFKTFKISTQRSKKDFPLTSPEINEKVGEFVLKKMKKGVDLKNPDITCFIEIVEKYAFLYLEKIAGLGGLPVGVSGKALVALSGGIDSPVAAFLAMKRGLRTVFLHFHAVPYTNRASIDKVKKIVKILNNFQFNSKLYLIPFADIQKEILLKSPAKLRVILYRRIMFRIAEKIAEKEKIKAVVTGENLGQVASQTLENLRAIQKATNLIVLRPVIGEDKFQIIEKAKKIGTYDISILPHQDCCAVFLPKHPETKAKLKEVEEVEKKLKIAVQIQASLSKMDLIDY